MGMDVGLRLICCFSLAGLFLVMSIGLALAQEEDEKPSIEITLEEGISMKENKLDEEGIPSPHTQMKSGVSPEDVICRHGFELIIKASDGSAACVSPSTASALLERGWAK